MITGNKGEWSEIYTLFKLVSDKQVNAGDSNLKKINGLFFPVIKILREETNGSFEFSYDRNLVLITGPNKQLKIAISDFKKMAQILLGEIKSGTGSSFSIPIIEQFSNSFDCHSLKAKSSDKSDIAIQIHDLRTGTNPELGFSIKSQLGGASTLLNASAATNFIYDIVGAKLSSKEAHAINAIDTKGKIQDRIQAIAKYGGKLLFSGIENQTFQNNLILIDSSLPIILGELLLTYFSTKTSITEQLASLIKRSNPLKYDQSATHPFYEYKIKRFLTDVALGMIPSKVWTGQLDATGGYLVVLDDGDILCYHIYNRNEFEEYLIYNSKFETPSSSRHRFGQLYFDKGILKFKLNLQIRFLQ